MAIVYGTCEYFVWELRKRARDWATLKWTEERYQAAVHQAIREAPRALWRREINTSLVTIDDTKRYSLAFPQLTRPGQVRRIWMEGSDGHDYPLSNWFVEWDALMTAAAGELLGNPGFEDPGAGGADIWAEWDEYVGNGALANETAVVHSGNDAAKLTAGATQNTVIDQLYLTVLPNRVYRFSVWTQGGTPAGAGRYRIMSISADIIPLTSTGISNTVWTEYVIEFVTPTHCVDLFLYLYCPDTDLDVCYFDDVSIMLQDTLTLVLDDLPPAEDRTMRVEYLMPFVPISCDDPADFTALDEDWLVAKGMTVLLEQADPDMADPALTAESLAYYRARMRELEDLKGSRHEPEKMRVQVW